MRNRPKGTRQERNAAWALQKQMAEAGMGRGFVALVAHEMHKEAVRLDGLHAYFAQWEV